MIQEIIRTHMFPSLSKRNYKYVMNTFQVKRRKKVIKSINDSKTYISFSIYLPFQKVRLIESQCLVSKLAIEIC